MPAPSLGVLVGLTFKESALGTVLWAFAKIWLFGLPVLWHIFLDKQPLSWSPPRRGGLLIGAITGIFIALIIVGAYFAIGHDALDPSLIQQKVRPLGLTKPTVYLAMAAYTVLINSMLEEYVYRWFMFRKLETLLGGQLAVIGSAVIFVIHHTIILCSYFSLSIVVLGSFGVLVGGIIWSWLYLRYRSIWPSYVSHAIVDVAVLGVGYLIIISVIPQ
ncbi:MAG: CPBP family intramembrane metalloprotease [Deltaproteobacteria bacterium]|nr:CPBP family intramembrane metalloprotease [Deltaproteobacteria bacterium]